MDVREPAAGPRTGERWLTHPIPGREPIGAVVVSAVAGVVAYRFDGEVDDGQPWHISERLFLATFERAPEGDRLAPAAPDPAPRDDTKPKPCCRRIGEWWCYRTDGHAAPAECRTPATRQLPSNEFDRGLAAASKRLDTGRSPTTTHES